MTHRTHKFTAFLAFAAILAMTATVAAISGSIDAAAATTPGGPAEGGAGTEQAPRSALLEGERVALRLEHPAAATAVAADHGLTIIDLVGSESEFMLAIATRAVSVDALDDDHRVASVTGPDALGMTATASGVFWAWGLFWAWGDDAQSGEEAIAGSAWDPSVGATAGSGTVVAVIDTGIDRSHWMFTGVHVADGYDFVDNDADPADSTNGVDDDGDGLVDEGAGHGTYVSSLIAQGAPGVTILPIRAIGDDGRTDTWTIARAIGYAVDQGADIINMSLGGTSRDRVLKRLIGGYTDDDGVLFIAAAGNTAQTAPTFPAAEDEPIAVGATDGSVVADFSARGAWVDLWAPGAGVVGARPGGNLITWDGTSASAAIVTAEAARVAADQSLTGATALRDALGTPLPVD